MHFSSCVTCLKTLKIRAPLTFFNICWPIGCSLVSLMACDRYPPFSLVWRFYFAHVCLSLGKTLPDETEDNYNYYFCTKNRKLTTRCCCLEANFSITLLISRYFAAVTLVAFDRGRLCNHLLVVAEIRFTDAYVTDTVIPHVTAIPTVECPMTAMAVCT